jgi:kumamolisin
VEAALDIEYAHGLAPKAIIYVVEAASNSLSDLFAGVEVASRLVQTAGRLRELLPNKSLLN